MNTTLTQTTSTTAGKTAFAFILVTSLFFLWCFSNNLNPILIPHLKKSFTQTILLIHFISSGFIFGPMPTKMIKRHSATSNWNQETPIFIFQIKNKEDTSTGWILRWMVLLQKQKITRNTLILLNLFYQSHCLHGNKLPSLYHFMKSYLSIFPAAVMMANLFK